MMEPNDVEQVDLSLVLEENGVKMLDSFVHPQKR